MPMYGQYELYRIATRPGRVIARHAFQGLSEAIRQFKLRHWLVLVPERRAPVV
jgi:hypothetical protein